MRQDEEYKPIKGIFVHTALSHLRFHEWDELKVRNVQQKEEDFIRRAMTSINTLMRLNYPIHLLEKSMDKGLKMTEIENFMQECEQEKGRGR